MPYEWPPRPELDREKAIRALSDALDEAWSRLEKKRVEILNDPDRLRKREVDAWFQEFQAAILAFKVDVDYQVRSFIALHLEPTYQAAVRQAAGGKIPWTEFHQAAMTSLALDTYSDFLERSEFAGQTARSMAEKVREAARRTVPLTTAGATTAAQAGRAFADTLLNDFAIDSVVYRNGARVPVAAYAQMAARTKSAVAYSSGTLNQALQAGFKYVEVFDGSDCGWTSHDDSDKANATIRTVEESRSHAISHPNCLRGFGPRPDLTTPQQAATATLSTTPEQREDQARFESEREAAARVRRAADRRRQALAARRQLRS